LIRRSEDWEFLGELLPPAHLPTQHLPDLLPRHPRLAAIDSGAHQHAIPVSAVVELVFALGGEHSPQLTLGDRIVEDVAHMHLIRSKRLLLHLDPHGVGVQRSETKALCDQSHPLGFLTIFKAPIIDATL
jgi:hypothetical protein